MIIENAKDPNSTGFVEDFNGDGYIASAILYGACVLCDFFTPTMIALLGLKASLVLSSLVFAGFVATFYALMVELLYAASAVWGVANALISVALVIPPHNYPTNVAGVQIVMVVMGCSNSRAGIRMVKKKALEQPKSNPNFDSITNYHYWRSR